MNATPERKNTQWLNGIGDLLGGGYVGGTSKIEGLYGIKTATPKPRASTIKTLSSLIGLKPDAPHDSSPATFEFDNELEASPDVKSTKVSSSFSTEGIKIESAYREEEKNEELRIEKPTTAKPTEAGPTEIKVSEPKKIDDKPKELKPVETKPIVVLKPKEIKPVETKPIVVPKPKDLAKNPEPARFSGFVKKPESSASTVKLDLTKKLSDPSKPLTITKKPSLGTLKSPANKSSFLSQKVPVKKEEPKPAPVKQE